MIGDDEGADQWQNSYQNHNSGKFSPNNFNNYDSSPVQNNLTPVFNRYVKPGKSILKKPNDEIVFNLSLHPTSPKPPLPPPDNSAASSSGKAGQLGDTITSSSGNTGESSKKRISRRYRQNSDSLPVLHLSQVQSRNQR